MAILEKLDSQFLKKLDVGVIHFKTQRMEKL